MKYSVGFYGKAIKQWKKFDKILQGFLRSKLKELEKDPVTKRAKADIRMLSGYTNPPLWRLRAGRFRAIYEIDRKEKKVKIILIGERESIYDILKRTSR